MGRLVVIRKSEYEKPMVNPQSPLIPSDATPASSPAPNPRTHHTQLRPPSLSRIPITALESLFFSPRKSLTYTRASTCAKPCTHASHMQASDEKCSPQLITNLSLGSRMQKSQRKKSQIHKLRHRMRGAKKRIKVEHRSIRVGTFWKMGLGPAPLGRSARLWQCGRNHAKRKKERGDVRLGLG